MWFLCLVVLVQFATEISSAGQGSKLPPVIIQGPRNATVLVESEHTFTCQTRNASDIVEWFHYQANIRHLDGRYKAFRKRGKLVFSRVLASDTGPYECRASNSHGMTKSGYATLKVEAPVTMVTEPKNKTTNWGSNIQLKCEVAGIPLPHIEWWYKTNESSRWAPFVHPETEMLYTSHEIRFNATESAFYKCIATNQPSLTGPREINRTAFVRVLSKPSASVPPTAQSKCAPYQGSVCKKFLGNQNVYFNLSRGQSPASYNEDIVKALWQGLIEKVTGPCRIPAEKMLCHYAFPDCDISDDGRPTPKLLCREDCDAAKNLFCKTEWAQIEAQKDDGIFYQTRKHFRLPGNCSSLETRNSGLCTVVDLFEITSDKITTKCYEERGQYYMGPVNFTKSGLPCQSWSERAPHLPLRSDPHVYPILAGAGNACRNPGGEAALPWCYTASPFVRWEYCPVSPCFPQPNDQVENFLSIGTIIMVVVVVTISLSLIGLIGATFYRFFWKRHNSYNPTPQSDFEIDIDQLPDNTCYHQKPPVPCLNSKLERLEYPRNDILYIRDIGQGAFGRVFQASAPNICQGQEYKDVAVKVLRDDATQEMQHDFEWEAALLSDLENPNIIQLLGVCAIGRPMCLLLEYMSNGDLNEFLRNCSPNHFIVRRRSTEVLSGDSAKLAHFEQLTIAKQIVAGMLYLSEKGYVHRDLATRNCLVGEHLVVKISDFGLCRCLQNGEYQGSQFDAIPIRWMPLEAIVCNRFTRESDVWSFGVVLWEIFSFALQPYYGMSHEEVVKFIKDGKTLVCPDNTPQEVYSIMQQCWAPDPKLRSSFLTIQTHICTLLDDLNSRQKEVEKRKK